MKLLVKEVLRVPNIFETMRIIPMNDLKKILKVVNDNYFLILAKWRNYFEGQELKFYC